MRATILPSDPSKNKPYRVDSTTKQIKLRVWHWKTKRVRTVNMTITAFEPQPSPSTLARLEGYADNLRVIAMIEVVKTRRDNYGYAEISDITP